MFHCFAYIKGITGGIDINSFESYTRYTGHSLAAEIKLLVVPSFAIPKLIDYTIISQKSEYNTQYIKILTSYPDSTSKMGPGNVPYHMQMLFNPIWFW